MGQAQETKIDKFRLPQKYASETPKFAYCNYRSDCYVRKFPSLL